MATSSKGTKMTALVNIPLSMLHRAGETKNQQGRIEKGKTFTVEKEETVKLLKSLSYAKLIALLLVSMLLASGPFAAPGATMVAHAQTNLTTAQAAVVTQEGPGYVIYSATVDTVGTDSFRTPAFHIGGIDKSCATTCLNLFAEAWASDGTGTEDVDITVEFSSDTGQPSTWDAAAANAFTQVTTTAQFDTLSTIVGAVPGEYRSARWVRLVVAGQSGNPGDSDVTLRVYAVKPAALGNIGIAVNNGS